jgi:RNA polymerase sigma-70 factor (ECF subfamily)
VASFEHWGPDDPSRREGEEPESALLRGAQRYLDSRRLHGDVDPLSADSWERFFHEYVAVVNAAVERSLRSESDRLDCAQQIWAAIISRLPGFHYDPALGHARDWLMALIRHALADYLRHLRRHPLRRLGTRSVDDLQGREPDPAARYEQSSVQAEVRAALAALRGRVPERSYQVLYLRWFEGLSAAEIASRLGMRPEQVRLCHLRMIRKLRRLLVRRLGPGSFGRGTAGGPEEKS